MAEAQVFKFRRRCFLNNSEIVQRILVLLRELQNEPKKEQKAVMMPKNQQSEWLGWPKDSEMAKHYLPLSKETKKQLEVRTETDKCAFGEAAGFFHSSCCNAHFEGEIDKQGAYFVSCEKCGKFIAYLSGKFGATENKAGK